MKKLQETLTKTIESMKEEMNYLKETRENILVSVLTEDTETILTHLNKAIVEIEGTLPEVKSCITACKKIETVEVSFKALVNALQDAEGTAVTVLNDLLVIKEAIEEM